LKCKTLNVSPMRFYKAKADKATTHNPEIGSGLVRIAHKISATSGESQLVKIGEKYFRVRELG
jgi:hypothetical protein